MADDRDQQDDEPLATVFAPKAGPRPDGSFVWKEGATTYIAAPPDTAQAPEDTPDWTGWREVGVTTDTPLIVGRQEGKRALLDGIDPAASAARWPTPVPPPSREEFAESVRDAVRRVTGNHVPYAAPAFAAATRAAVALEDAQMRAMALAASHHVPAFVQDVVVEAQRRGELLGSPAAGWESVAADLRDARWTP